MTRTQILNYLINNFNLQKYLEIGVFTGENLYHVNLPVQSKTAVDPTPLIDEITHPITSDEFFDINTDTFDLIFIDGLHLSEQVTKDLENSIKVLNEGGFIVVHDCNPPTETHARRDRLSDPMPEWNGDVYKAFIDFKTRHGEYKVHCVDTDWGCGVIRKVNTDWYQQELVNIKSSSDDWNFFDKNRKELLNLISVDEFKKLYR